MAEAPKPYLGLGKDISLEALDQIAMTLMTELYRRRHGEDPRDETRHAWQQELAERRRRLADGEVPEGRHDEHPGHA
jgi:hypothetical protein